LREGGMIVRKRIAVEEIDGGGGGDVEWTYRLVDRVYTDSMVFVTAARFGVTDAIVARAT